VNNKLLALALAAGMATMVSGPALAQSKDHQGDHRGHHGDHRGHHGAQAGQTAVSPGNGEASDAQAEMPTMADCPMMQGGMMPMHQRHAPGHAGSASADMDMSASLIAFRAVNEAMHHGMDIEMTGNADVDFVRGMIAHHVGAVNMARIVQVFGSDREIAALAEEIVEAQEAEIAMMRDWLDRNAPDANE
jgi:uncharacterized protein (DUF305 family)